MFSWLCFHVCFIAYWSISITRTSADLDVNLNVTHFIKQRLQRRSLIFEGGGDVRLVVGPIFPVQFDDPINWRSLIVLYNIHGGIYNLPTAPLYPWDKYESIFARSMHKLRVDQEKGSAYPKDYEDLKVLASLADNSRLFVYTAMESFMNRQKPSSGRICLLRSICENSQVQQHVGILAEILNVVLTPGKEDIDGSYKSAYEAGISGVDCLKMYEDCPMGSNILDLYLEFL